MKEEIYRWVKTIAFFYIVFSAVLHLVPDVKYERYIRSFMGILLIYILSIPVFRHFTCRRITAGSCKKKFRKNVRKME